MGQTNEDFKVTHLGSLSTMHWGLSTGMFLDSDREGLQSWHTMKWFDKSKFWQPDTCAVMKCMLEENFSWVKQICWESHVIIQEYNPCNWCIHACQKRYYGRASPILISLRVFTLLCSILILVIHSLLVAVRWLFPKDAWWNGEWGVSQCILSYILNVLQLYFILIVHYIVCIRQ